MMPEMKTRSIDVYAGKAIPQPSEPSLLKPEDFGLPPDIRILAQQDENLFLCEVPIESIAPFKTSVSSNRLAEIGQKMSKESQNRKYAGQLLPGLLAQVGDDLHICDGIHRLQAHRVQGDSIFYATIRTNSSIEAVYDYRITAASEHADVSFARSVQWITDIWNLTPWSKKISIMQVLSLVTVPGMTGERLGITTQQTSEIKSWIREKCEAWKKKPSGVFQYFIIANKADPDLVAEARSGRVKGELSLAQLRAIANALPGEARFQDQKSVKEVAVTQNLTEKETRSLALKIAAARSPELKATLLTLDWKASQKTVKEVKREARVLFQHGNSENQKTLQGRIAELEAQLAHAQQQLSQAAEQIKRLRSDAKGIGKTDLAVPQDDLSTLKKKLEHARSQNYHLGENLKEADERIKQLEKLKDLTTRDGRRPRDILTTESTLDNTSWWRWPQVGLTSVQKETMIALMEERISVSFLTARKNIPESEITARVARAMEKYALYLATKK